VIGAFVEVGAHPVAQVDCLTHINDITGAVFHNVTARFVGQRIQDSLQVFARGHWSNFTIPEKPTAGIFSQPLGSCVGPVGLSCPVLVGYYLRMITSQIASATLFTVIVTVTGSE